MKTLPFSAAPAAAGAVESAASILGKVRSWLVALHRVSPALSWAGWLHVLLLPGLLLALALDERLVTGVNPWLKPLKFIFADTIYLWSLGWLLAGLPAAAQRAVRRIGWGVAGAILVEIVVVCGQAARGTTSHYNDSSPLNSILFALMGQFILLNTILTLWAVYLVWRYRPQGPAGYVWGVRLGLLLFLLGSLLGGMMIHLNQHTVGAPDGGPGLPGTGWSTRAGDLRIAHFFGLHALQLVPLLGWWLSRHLPRRAVLLTWVGAALYAGAVAGLFWQAMQGIPLWATR